VLVEASASREPRAVLERDASGAMAAVVTFNPPSVRISVLIHLSCVILWDLHYLGTHKECC
jgi:hypothetical protein